MEQNVIIAQSFYDTEAYSDGVTRFCGAMTIERRGIRWDVVIAVNLPHGFGRDAVKCEMLEMARRM